jgi:hypothetical protein
VTWGTDRAIRTRRGLRTTRGRRIWEAQVWRRRCSDVGVTIGVMSIIVGIVAAALGLVLVRRTVPLAVLQEHHEVAGVTFAVVGGFYSVVLAFVLVASWERFERARANTEVEANALGALAKQAAGVPEPTRTILTRDINAYLGSVVDSDWPAMLDDRLSPQAQALYVEIWRAVLDMQPQDPKEVALYQCMIQKLDDFGEARRDRVLYMENALPPLIWNFLILFGIVTVAFTYLFGMPRMIPQMIITVALAATIACTLFIIWEMQTPFSGAVLVSDRAFRVMLDTLHP